MAPRSRCSSEDRLWLVPLTAGPPHCRARAAGRSRGRRMARGSPRHGPGRSRARPRRNDHRRDRPSVPGVDDPPLCVVPGSGDGSDGRTRTAWCGRPRRRPSRAPGRGPRPAVDPQAEPLFPASPSALAWSADGEGLLVAAGGLDSPGAISRFHGIRGRPQPFSWADVRAARDRRSWQEVRKMIRIRHPFIGLIAVVLAGCATAPGPATSPADHRRRGADDRGPGDRVVGARVLVATGPRCRDVHHQPDLEFAGDRPRSPCPRAGRAGTSRWSRTPSAATVRSAGPMGCRSCLRSPTTSTWILCRHAAGSAHRRDGRRLRDGPASARGSSPPRRSR